MIADLDDEVKTYLLAVGAVAIYVATVDGSPVRVGFTHDPHKTRAFLARHWPSIDIAWLAWFDESKAATFFASITTNVVELVIQRRNDGINVPRSLATTITHIERIAREHGVTLTAHERALDRAKLCIFRLDRALRTLEENGHLGAFNRAYKAYRESQHYKSESALPYWAARAELRRIVIRYLVAHDELAPHALLEEIRKRFPWFRTNRPSQKRTPSNSSI